jgi:DNA invertase Pin-like site-specific DNA recombinase
MFQMCGVFAEFERGMIRERVNARACAGQGEGQEAGSTSDQAGR